MSTSAPPPNPDPTNPNPNPTAFRSFWAAPSSSINQTRPDEYQGIPIARATEQTPLLATEEETSGRWSKQRKYGIICCLLLLIIIAGVIVWLWLHHIIGGGGGGAPARNETSIATLCNPFSFDPKPNVDLRAGHGIVATIRYLNDPYEQSRAYNTHDYENGHLLNQTFFLSSLDVPTRVFTDQFVDREQHHLPSEFFGMTANTRIGLSPDDKIGNYQFALLSDDGSIMTISDTDTSKHHLLIDNDGVHTTRLATAQTNVTFRDRDQKHSVTIQWFQGPPAHIALMLLWREASADLKEANDGVYGNDEWFDWRRIPSVPTSRYNSLLHHGWKPVDAKNFYLPESFAQQKSIQAMIKVGINPCEKEY